MKDQITLVRAKHICIFARQNTTGPFDGAHLYSFDNGRLILLVFLERRFTESVKEMGALIASAFYEDFDSLSRTFNQSHFTHNY